jgi:hypothetical protein
MIETEVGRKIKKEPAVAIDMKQDPFDYITFDREY